MYIQGILRKSIKLWKHEMPFPRCMSISNTLLSGGDGKSGASVVAMFGKTCYNTSRDQDTISALLCF